MADSKWGEGRLPPSKNSDLQKCGNDSLVVIYALAFTKVSPPPPPPNDIRKFNLLQAIVARKRKESCAIVCEKREQT